MPTRKLIRSEVVPGTVEHFRALMQRLAVLYSGRNGWVSTNGKRLVWYEYRHVKQELVSRDSPGIRQIDRLGRHYRTVDITPPMRSTWEVFLWPDELGWDSQPLQLLDSTAWAANPEVLTEGWRIGEALGHAGIEAFERPDGRTRVDCWDGYVPGKRIIETLRSGHRWEPIGPAFEEFCQMVIREAPQATPDDRQTRGGGLAATWKLLIPFDILDAAVNRDLHGYAPGFVEFERREDTHGSVVYRMWQEDLGDLGTLTVRKAGDRTSVLEVSNPPHPQHRDPTPEEMAEIHAITGQREQDRAWGTLMTGIWQETDDLYQRRKKHQQDVRKALFSRMAHDPALAEWWPKVIGAESPTPTEDGAARLESASSINDILRRIDEMHLNLGGKLNDLKRGQVLIYQHIDAEDQGALRAIRKEIRQQRIEQGEMQNALDAIRRVLKHIHEAGLPVADDAIKQSLADIYQTVNSDIGLRQQLELSLPVIPFLLEYKIGLDERVDLGAVWKKLKAYSERSKRAIG